MKKNFLLYLSIFLFFSLLNSLELNDIEFYKKYSQKNVDFFVKANKKTYDLKKSNPIFFQPSKRSIIDFQKKGQDTIRVLVLKVEFLEDTTSLTTGNGKMDLRRSIESIYVVDTIVQGGDTLIDTSMNIYYKPPHDSLYFYRQMEALRNYYLDDSRGKLYVDFEIYPKGLHDCYTVKHQMQFYGDTLNIVYGMFYLLRDALKEAEISGGIDFNKFDAVIVFHAGSMWQTDYYGDSPFDIPAVYIQGASYIFGEPITVGGKSFEDGVIYSETAFQDGGYAFIQGGLVHEFAHQLGIFDMYDTSNRRMGMGGWNLQGTGNWNLAGLVPPHQGGYNSVSRFNTKPNNDYSNWIYFNQTKTIYKDTTGLRIKYLGSDEDTSIKFYKIPLNSHEYFLIENRFAYSSKDTLSNTPDSNGFRVWKDGVLVKINDYDISLPCPIDSGGLAIYHIDETIIANDSGYNMINAGPVLGVDMEEADRVQDFELSFYDVVDWDKTFYGTYEDLFRSGGVSNQFSPKTYPNTDANNSGKTHIYIYNISNSDTVMSFSVLFDYRRQGYPFALRSAPDVNSPKILKKDGKYYIIVQTENGELYAIDKEGKPLSGSTGIVGNFNVNSFSYSTIAVGNVANSGGDEISFTDYDGNVHLLRTDTLNPAGYFLPLKNSPVNLDGKIVSSPVLYDIDKDSFEEVLITSENMFLYLLDFDSLSGFYKKDSTYLNSSSWSLPIVLDDRIVTLGFDGVVRFFDFDLNELYYSKTEYPYPTTSSPVAIDVDGDSIVEIVFVRGDGTFFVISSLSGEVKSTKKLPFENFYSSPVPIDYNNDGLFEIALIAQKNLYLLDFNGNIVNGFPKRFSEEIQSSPLSVDLDDDGINEILVHTKNGLLVSYSNKNPTPGFPLSTGQYSNSTPLVCDIDNDSLVDIVACADSTIIAFELKSKINGKNWNGLHYSNSNNRYFKYSSNKVSGDLLLVEDGNNYMYPNPTNGKIKLRFSTQSAKEYSFMVFDQSKTLKYSSPKYKAKLGVNEVDLSFDYLAPGFYKLRLMLTDGERTLYRNFNFGVIR
ncbi:MAG: hypothetical protein WHT27_01490 [candidate division WOR-3 bacterium]